MFPIKSVLLFLVHGRELGNRLLLLSNQGTLEKVWAKAREKNKLTV